MPLRIFVASSSAAKRQAKVFVEYFDSPEITFIPWWDVFTAGRTLLEELDRIVHSVNAALLFITPEASFINTNGTEIVTPNLNVLFEFGYFYNALGKDKVALIKYSKVDLPSDLNGYIHITGSKFFQRNNSVSVGKRTETEYRRWISAMLTGI